MTAATRFAKAVQRRMQERRKVRVSVQLTPEVISIIDSAAHRIYVTRADIVKLWLRERCDSESKT